MNRLFPISLLAFSLSLSTQVLPAHSQTAPAPSEANSAKSGIIININGRVVDAPAVMRNKAVLVPLRGVLENLGAQVSYDNAQKSITIARGSDKTVLKLGDETAISNLQSVKLSAAPQLIGPSVYVPLRSLAELFGYEVQWLAPQKTVAIRSDAAPKIYADHQKALAEAGHIGVGIDFSDATLSDADRLLDAAKESGVKLIKVRFDWHTLEPTAGSTFQWPLYDHIVKAARERGLIVTGVLGNSAKWASIFSRSNDINEWRGGAPRDDAMKAWSNYVTRVVGRYKNDVHAWQVWERPSSELFRAGRRSYRNVVRLASLAARQSDPKAIVFSGEPGGVNLEYLGDMNTNGLAKSVDGVSLYPTAQFQPGAPAPLEDFLRPYNVLTQDNGGFVWGSGNPQSRQFWVGGLSWPVLGEVDGAGLEAAGDDDTRTRLTRIFTPQSQANYLVRAITLALAAGVPKVFWQNLRDADSYERVEPFNPDFHSGLFRRDFSPRPSFTALKVLLEQTRGKNYLGTLAADARSVVMVFGNKDNSEISAVAWGDGSRRLMLDQGGKNPNAPESVFIATRPTSRVLSVLGEEVGGASGAVPLGSSPVWISNIAYETANAAREREADGLLALEPHSEAIAGDTLTARFGTVGEERGLYWKRFRNFRSQAQKVQMADGEEGITTEISNDIYNPAAGRYFLTLDVSDDFLFFNRKNGLKVTVRVKRPISQGETLVGSKAGFNIKYLAPGGEKYTEWQIVEPGEGWAEYSFIIPDALLINSGGGDLTINTFGSKRALLFSQVTVTRVAPEN